MMFTCRKDFMGFELLHALVWKRGKLMCRHCGFRRA